MTPERMEELREWSRTGLALRDELAECLDEIDRLEALLADCRPLDDAIRKQERKRAAEMLRDRAKWCCEFEPGWVSVFTGLADRIERGDG